MTRCLFGSKKQANAPATFKIDTGAICFILNIDSPICELLDKIPSLVGEGWKEILKEVASSALTFVTSDDVNTAAFCSMPPPLLPEAITYSEVFQLIASYVPPLSLVASSSPILKKISDYYLFVKWNEFCECKTRREIEPEPDIDNPDLIKLPKVQPNPSNCPSIQVINGINDFIVSFDAVNDIQRDVAKEINDAASGALDNFLSFMANLIEVQNLASFSEPEVTRSPPPPPLASTTVTRTSGCMSITFRTSQAIFYVTETYSSTAFNQDGTVFGTRGEIRTERIWEPVSILSVDIAACNCGGDDPNGDRDPDEELPPLPVPPLPTNCIPVPPKRFCELFPNDPLCANVPDNGNACPDAIELEVPIFDNCEASTKTVFWRIE